MASQHAFFDHAGRIDIGEAHMQMNINHHHAQMDEEKRLMSLLANQSAPTAQFDSKERYKPPRCAESTRENILKKLRDWVDTTTTPDSSANPNNNPSSFASSFFWLHGGAGAGKSALAQSLSEQLKEAGSLAASFFFFTMEASRNNGDKLIPTIVYQLTRIHSQYEKKVIEQLKRNQDIFGRSRHQQMKVLFTDALIALHTEGVDASTFPRLIVIDGLDECKGTETQCDILAIIAENIPHLPYHFRFLVASRPEGHIIRTFESNKWIKKIPFQKYDLSKDSDASKDIRTFLQQEFKRLCEAHVIGSTLQSSGWPSESDVVTLIDRSSGHFVYPATVIRYIESVKHRPDDRLAIVLGLYPRGPKDQPFSQLDALYMLILNDVQESDFIRIKRSFSILYLISEKVGYFSIYRSGSSRIIFDMLKLRAGDLDMLIEPLRSLVAQESEEENLHVFHKTLFDFLLDSERSQRFTLTKQLCHESAALYMHNTDILTSWSYAPDFMYFAYHCYLAQPIRDDRLIRFLQNLDILYTDGNPRGNASANQNEKALLAMFIDEGEQAPGAKTIFYILRVLSLLNLGRDLHELHSKKITQFYASIKPKSSSTGNGQTNGANGASSESASAPMSVDGEEHRDRHAALDEMIRSKLTSWQPSEDILRAITAANEGSTSTTARDTLIKREHAVFSSFARAQHLPDSDYHLQSTLLPSDSSASTAPATAPEVVNTVVAHSYHIFSVEYETDPSLMVLVGTYSRGGKGGEGVVVVESESVVPGLDDSDVGGEDDVGGGGGGIVLKEVGVGKGAGAVYSAQSFDYTLLSETEFEEQMGKFLSDHIAKVEKELAQVIDDQFESHFEF